MLMIGRGAVMNPGLGLAIKADMNQTSSSAVTWVQMLPLVLDFWQIVTTRLDNKAQAGRLKQWLNFLRRHFPEAEVAYAALKTINNPAVIDAWLASATRSSQLRQETAKVEPISVNDKMVLAWIRV
mgnify:CR=1 FL=1